MSYILKAYTFAVECEGETQIFDVEAYNLKEATFIAGAKFAAMNPDFNSKDHEFRIRRVK